MTDSKEMKAKNIDPGMISKETPLLDATRIYIGYNPRAGFKRGYLRSLKLDDNKLRKTIMANAGRVDPRHIAPYLYDAQRRGISIPSNARSLYNIPDESYVRDLNIISGEPAEKYVNTAIAGAGALTGMAALDYLGDRVQPKHMVVHKAVRAGMVGPERLKRKIVGKSGRNIYNKIFEAGMSSSIGSGNPKKSKLVERLMGAAHTMPASGLLAVPLMSRSVTTKLKGENKDSARYKAFNWVENNPGKVLAGAFVLPAARTMAGGYYDLAHVLKNAPKDQMKKHVAASLSRTGVAAGRLWLMASIPYMYIKMRRHMDDARDEEKKLVDTKIVKDTREQ